MMKYFSIILIFSFLTRCSKAIEHESPSIRKSILADKSVFHLMEGDSILAEVGFKNDGQLDYVVNFPIGLKQVIYFHSETGFVESKMVLDAMDSAHGKVYYFRMQNESLSGVYNFDNGVLTGNALSYHDSSLAIESVLLYDSIGNLYYRKSFDELGNHIGTEGSKEIPNN